MMTKNHYWLITLFLYVFIALPVSTKATPLTLSIYANKQVVTTKQYITSPTSFTIQLENIDSFEQLQSLTFQYHLRYPIVTVNISEFTYNPSLHAATAELILIPNAKYANYSSEFSFWFTSDTNTQIAIQTHQSLYITLGSRVIVNNPTLTQIVVPETFYDAQDLKIVYEFSTDITYVPININDLKIKLFNTTYEEKQIQKGKNTIEVTLKNVVLENPNAKATIIAAYKEKYQFISCKSLMLNMKQALEEKYPIKIILWNVPSKDITNLQAMSLLDTNKINDMLKLLDDSLSKYPIEFLNEISEYIGDLEIYFAQSISSSAYGITGYYKMNQTLSVYMMLIDNSYLFSQTFHHEFFHVIEYALYFKDSTKPFGHQYNLWNTFNSVDFQYHPLEMANESLILSSNNDLENTYFINKYAQTTPYEDRATLFSELMICSTPKPYHQIISDLPLTLKMLYLIDVIESNFESLHSENTLYWKRHFY